MMQNKIIFIFNLAMLFALQSLLAQEIELPAFETPEQLFYNLLQEEKIKFPTKNNGKLKSLKRTYKTFKGNVETLVETEVTIFNEKGEITENYFIHDGEKFDDYSEPPSQFKDSIDGFLRIKVIEDEYGFKDHFYQNNLLKKYTLTEEGLPQVEKEFNYNTNKKLIKEQTYNFSILFEENDKDKAMAAARILIDTEEAIYKNNKLSQKTLIYAYDEKLNVSHFKYQYNEEQLLSDYSYEVKSHTYPESIIEIPNPAEGFSVLDTLSTTTLFIKGEFKYDTQKRLKKFRLIKPDVELPLESYKISYAENTMTIKGVLMKNESLDPNNTTDAIINIKYIYKFDEKGNPITIKSYLLQNEVYILDKETIVDIEYFEN